MPDRLRALVHDRRVQIGFNASVGVALLGFMVKAIPIGQIAAHVRPAHSELLLGLVAALVLSQVVRAARWRWLLQPLTLVGLRDALWVNTTTQLLNYLVPIRAGEAARMLWLARRRGVAGGTAAGVIIIDHTFDLLGVITVLGIGLSLRLSRIQPGLPTAPTLGLALLGAVLMLAGIAFTATCGPALARSRFLPEALRHHLQRHALAFRAGTLVARGGRLPVLLLASAAAVALDGLAFALLFMALGLAVPMVSAMVAQVALLYAYLLPAAPGYVGSLEAGGTLLLTGGLGLAGGAAAGAMVVWHGLGAVVVFGLGLLALHELRRSGQLVIG